MTAVGRVANRKHDNYCKPGFLVKKSDCHRPLKLLFHVVVIKQIIRAARLEHNGSVGKKM